MYFLLGRLYDFKILGNIALVKLYSVIHIFVTLEDAKMAFCDLEKVCKGLWPVFEGDGHSLYPTKLWKGTKN